MRSLILSVVVPALLSAIGAEPQASEAIDVPIGQRQLFLDDYGVAKTRGLQRTMHQPEKKGAVVRPDQPWELWLQTHCMPAWDEQQQIFKLWLLNCTPNPHEGGSTYVESKDGIHWTKPILRQKKYQGSLENNLLREPVLLHPSVVYDPNDSDPNRRYKGLFFGPDNKNGDAMQPTVSPDGIYWKKLDVPKIPSMDESNLSYSPLTHTFIATVKTLGPHGRSHAIWTSNDFEKWTKQDVVFSADDLDQKLGRKNIERCYADPARKHPEYNIPSTYYVDVYNLGVFRYGGLYIGMPSMFHQTGKVSKDWDGFDKMPLTEEVKQSVRRSGDWTGFHHVQLACSRDLRQWTRLGERRPFLDMSPAGGDAYDTQVILPPSDAMVHGDELWFYYTGMRSYAIVSGPIPDQGAVCLAVLRRDGFISLDAGETPGTLLTKPFVVSGTELFVNADAAGGNCKVEVLDGHNKALAVSEPVVGDQPHANVQWKSGDLAGLKGQTVCLRFTLRNAKLYSFWLEDRK